MLRLSTAFKGSKSNIIIFSEIYLGYYKWIPKGILYKFWS